MMTQTAMTLLFGTAAEARVPELGAQRRHRRRAGRLLRPLPGVAGPDVDLPGLPGPDPGLDLPRGVVLVQLIEASFGLFSASANGGGVAFFAHVGGFIFGLLAARLLARAGQTAPGEQWRSTA